MKDPSLGRLWQRAGRALRIMATTTLVAIVAMPVVAWAGDQFTDVPDSNTFHDDIAWMADTGVTKGCNPPDNTEYCPDANVTREQMAAFMHRLETEGVFLTGDPIEDWHAVGTSGEPTFEGSWGNYGADYREVGFLIDRDGVVHLRGGAARPSDAASSTTMFQLPAGYRPAKTVAFGVASTDGFGALNPGGGMIEVQPDGDVRVYGASDERYISLNGVYFDTRG